MLADAPLVFRNPRYERRIMALEQRITELTTALQSQMICLEGLRCVVFGQMEMLPGEVPLNVRQQHSKPN